jgi:hypothetical protein
MLGLKRHALQLAAAAMVVGLAACQSGSLMGGSPAGIPIAFESIDGPPPPVKTMLEEELVSAASSRQVELAGMDSQARYRVRGYLSAEASAEGGTALAFVWDVFDAEKRRAKRLTGSSAIRVASGDVWTGLDREALRKLAAQSMDEIAGFLSESRSEAPTATAEAAPASADGALGFATQ